MFIWTLMNEKIEIYKNLTFYIVVVYVIGIFICCLYKIYMFMY
jgi:hypothetical protein